MSTMVVCVPQSHFSFIMQFLYFQSLPTFLSSIARALSRRTCSLPFFLSYSRLRCIYLLRFFVVHFSRLTNSIAIARIYANGTHRLFNILNMVSLSLSHCCVHFSSSMGSYATTAATLMQLIDARIIFSMRLKFKM